MQPAPCRRGGAHGGVVSTESSERGHACYYVSACAGEKATRERRACFVCVLYIYAYFRRSRLSIGGRSGQCVWLSPEPVGCGLWAVGARTDRGIRDPANPGNGTPAGAANSGTAPCSVSPGRGLCTIFPEEILRINILARRARGAVGSGAHRHWYDDGPAEHAAEAAPGLDSGISVCDSAATSPYSTRR